MVQVGEEPEHAPPVEEEVEDIIPVMALHESETALRPSLHTGVPLDLYDSSPNAAIAQMMASMRAADLGGGPGQ